MVNFEIYIPQAFLSSRPSWLVALVVGSGLGSVSMVLVDVMQ
jgi:hypothetical protein